MCILTVTNINKGIRQISTACTQQVKAASYFPRPITTTKQTSKFMQFHTWNILPTSSVKSMHHSKHLRPTKPESDDACNHMYK